MFRHTLLVCFGAVLAFGAGSEDRPEKLYSAIRANHVTELRALLKQGASANTPDAKGITPLMIAAETGSVESMRILIHKGADVNAQNAFGQTALMWSVGDPQKVKLLLANGADVTVASKNGRTALLLAALTNPSAEVVKMLLAKGADPKVVDATGFTTLLAATAGNDTESIRLMIEAGVDVNAGEKASMTVIPGVTPLMFAAANGNPDAVKMLLAKGADVNAVSTRDKLQQVKNGPIALGGFTALMLTPAYGPQSVVKALLDAGADPNARDIRGMTALMFALASDRRDPEIVKMLLAHGADPGVRDKTGATAAMWARRNGSEGFAETVAAKVPDMGKPVRAEGVALREAVQKSVALLEKTHDEFFRKSGCVSCHAQGTTEFGLTAARAKGIAVNEALAHERQQQIVGLLNGAGPMLMERMDPPGSPDTLLYALEALAREDAAASPLTDYLTAHLAMEQTADGSWHFGGLARPPMEDGDFTRTALAIRALKRYGAPGRAAEYEARIERAKQWLLHADPATQEDRSMKLAGLSAAGVDAAALRRIATPLLAKQRTDGGWAQRDELASDAYATGMALWALAESGVMKPGEAAYQQGVRFLLDTQAEDGSWHVVSRTPKLQPYFESGFPYGHDQWISSAATGWATNALALALDTNPVSHAGRKQAE